MKCNKTFLSFNKTLLYLCNNLCTASVHMFLDRTRGTRAKREKETIILSESFVFFPTLLQDFFFNPAGNSQVQENSDMLEIYSNSLDFCSK